MGKKEFAQAFKEARDSKGWTLEQCGDALDVRGASISNWKNPEKVDKPRTRRWKQIKDLLGVDCQKYFSGRDVSVSGSSSQGVMVADNGSSINVSNVVGQGDGEYVVKLTRFEYRLWDLFRKYGNQTIAEKCMKQLQAIEAMSAI